MQAHYSGWRLISMTGALAIIIPLTGAALDSAPKEALRITVLPDRYVVGASQFSDLVALATWVKPIQTGVIQLDVCGAAASKQLLAAVERFHATYVEGLEIRTLSADDSECLLKAAQTNWPNEGTRRQLTPDEHLATDEYGRSTMP